MVRTSQASMLSASSVAIVARLLLFVKARLRQGPFPQRAMAISRRLAVNVSVPIRCATLARARRLEVRVAPSRRMLFIVSPAKRDLAEALRAAFVSERGVDVIVDRRIRERRRADRPHPVERRRTGRRGRPVEDTEVREYGWTVIRMT